MATNTKQTAKPKKRGRPTKYSQALVDQICSELATSDISLHKICAREEMPGLQTVLDWLERYEDFRGKYARAREFQADYIADSMSDAEKGMLAKEIPSDVGRAVIWSRQWRAGRLKPKRYGDRVVHAGDSEAPLTVEVVQFARADSK